MRHVEPEQLAPRRQEPKARGRRSLWLPALVLMGLAFAGGYGATLLVPPGSADVVTAAESKSRVEDFERVQALALAAVPSERRGTAIAQMGLPQKESDALATLVSLPAQPPGPSPQSQAQAQPAQRLGLVELVLWDTHAADGDVVLVSSAGYSREVLLSKGPALIHVPGTGTGTIQITGMRDGGGGITLAVKGASASILMPIMSVGQTLSLPVSFP